MLLIWSLVGAALLVGLDQWVKLWAYNTLRTGGDVLLIPNVLHLVYWENTGAAFSILTGRTTFLAVVTGAVLLCILLLLVLKKITEPLLIIAFSLILSGGVGNLIDRIVRGFVVDYIYFVPINFPVFNIADCCVVIGCGLMIFGILMSERKNKGALPREPHQNG